MPYDVQIVEVVPRRIAAVHEPVMPLDDISLRFASLLDEVWSVLLPNKVKTDHVLALYQDVWQGADGKPVFDALFGVEIFDGFPAHDRVIESQTPGGRVATTAHIGPYAELGKAYDAISQWCEANGVARMTCAWEVYGEWTDDQTKLRTDVFFQLA